MSTEPSVDAATGGTTNPATAAIRRKKMANVQNMFGGLGSGNDSLVLLSAIANLCDRNVVVRRMVGEVVVFTVEGLTSQIVIQQMMNRSPYFRGLVFSGGSDLIYPFIVGITKSQELGVAQLKVVGESNMGKALSDWVKNGRHNGALVFTDYDSARFNNRSYGYNDVSPPEGTLLMGYEYGFAPPQGTILVSGSGIWLQGLGSGSDEMAMSLIRKL